MKILVLGITGLIGRYIFSVLYNSFDVIGTTRKKKVDLTDINLYQNKNILYNFDILKSSEVKNKIIDLRPDYIINCIGITKRKITDNDIDVIYTNSIFPHKLSKLSELFNCKVIHFSTDCVFSGDKGFYDEESNTDALDLYGKTKALGEIKYKNSLTIRSSFIGLELYDKTELLEWVLSQNGKKINGYKKTMYSGVTTLFLAQFVKKILNLNFTFSGLYNLSPKVPISKYDLIELIIEEFQLNINLIKEERTVHNPTLDGELLRKELNFIIPSWKQMLKELNNYKL